MEIENITLDDIHPAKYNPRHMQETEMTKLEKSLQTYGLTSPIIIDLTDNNTIIGGHQRYTALQNTNPQIQLQLIRNGDIGLVVDTREKHIKDKNDQKALNLALNRINGEWDEGKLHDLIQELQSDDYLLELTGFDDYELIELDLDNEYADIEELFTNETDEEELLDFTDAVEDEQETLNIQLYSDKQRQTLLNLITKLKKEHPDKSIAENLTNYLETHIQPQENIQPYTIVFDNNQQKEKFIQQTQKLKENKRYNGSITLVIQEDDQQ